MEHPGCCRTRGWGVSPPATCPLPKRESRSLGARGRVPPEDTSDAETPPPHQRALGDPLVPGRCAARPPPSLLWGSGGQAAPPGDILPCVYPSRCNVTAVENKECDSAGVCGVGDTPLSLCHLWVTLGWAGWGTRCASVTPHTQWGLAQGALLGPHPGESHLCVERGRGVAVRDIGGRVTPLNPSHGKGGRRGGGLPILPPTHPTHTPNGWGQTQPLPPLTTTQGATSKALYCIKKLRASGAQPTPRWRVLGEGVRPGQDPPAPLSPLLLLVAPLGHLVVDGHLLEAAGLHVGSHLLQGLQGHGEHRGPTPLEDPRTAGCPQGLGSSPKGWGQWASSPQSGP